jgi:outer membrane protein assembly factor BamD
VLGHNFPGSQWYADSYGLVQNGKLPPEDRPNILVRSFNWLF